MNLETIISSATECARKYGVDRITRDMVASASGCSPALVSHYCGTMEKLKEIVVTIACRKKDVQILLFILNDNRYRMTPRARKAVLDYLTKT